MCIDRSIYYYCLLWSLVRRANVRNGNILRNLARPLAYEYVIRIRWKNFQRRKFAYEIDDVANVPSSRLRQISVKTGICIAPDGKRFLWKLRANKLRVSDWDVSECGKCDRPMGPIAYCSTWLTIIDMQKIKMSVKRPFVEVLEFRSSASFGCHLN